MSPEMKYQLEILVANLDENDKQILMMIKLNKEKSS
jgi:hypothetical protein